MSNFYANWTCETPLFILRKLHPCQSVILKIVPAHWIDDSATDYLHRDSELFWSGDAAPYAITTI